MSNKLLINHLKFTVMSKAKKNSKKKNEVKEIQPRPFPMRTVDFLVGVTDFSQFKQLKGANREPNEIHIKVLMKSFEKWGAETARIIVIRTKAFDGKDTDYKADGGHTSIALNRLGLSANVQVVKFDGIADTKENVTKYIASLNNTSKAWSNNNYLEAWCGNGIVEYLKFNDIMKETGLKITDLLHIYTGQGGTKDFHNGDLKFTNEKEGDELLKATIKVKELIPKLAMCRRQLYKVMRQCNDYNRFADAIITVAHGLKVAQSSFSHKEDEFREHLQRILLAEFSTKKAA
jgi:predicted nucleic acid-binding protein